MLLPRKGRRQADRAVLMSLLSFRPGNRGSGGVRATAVQTTVDRCGLDPGSLAPVRFGGSWSTRPPSAHRGIRGAGDAQIFKIRAGAGAGHEGWGYLDLPGKSLVDRCVGRRLADWLRDQGRDVIGVSAVRTRSG